MGTTTISLRDEAYERLKETKREDKSFSDVVIRLTGPGRTTEELEDLAGGLDSDFARAVERSSDDVREGLEPTGGGSRLLSSRSSSSGRLSGARISPKSRRG